jgi:glycerate kinase
LLKGCPIVSLRTHSLVASEPFGPRLSASAVALAISRGLQAGDSPQADLCPLPPLDRDGNPRELLDSIDFDLRMRAARAVILATRRLHESALAGSLVFEIATRARQSGVPAYAVVAMNELDSFDARILDLQLIFEAKGPKTLEAAGRALAEVL